ncbi:MAG: hypothetical protein ACLUOI_03695 [Eisenbergiella sp.]
MSIAMLEAILRLLIRCHTLSVLISAANVPIFWERPGGGEKE